MNFATMYFEMKRSIIGIFVMFLAWIGAASCNYTIECREPRDIRYFSIPDYDSSVKTRLRVVRYDANGSFSSAIDSTDLLLPSPFDIEVPADPTKDYVIVLLPQNRRHRLQNVKFGHETRKGSPGRDSEQCQTSISFNFDGTSLTQPWTVGGTSTGAVPHLVL